MDRLRASIDIDKNSLPLLANGPTSYQLKPTIELHALVDHRYCIMHICPGPINYPVYLRYKTHATTIEFFIL